MNAQLEASPARLAPRSIRLSSREMDVLRMVWLGYSSQEVGDALFVSKRTVEFHLSSVYAKLGVGNRIQAFQAAMRCGLVPYEPTSGPPCLV